MYKLIWDITRIILTKKEYSQKLMAQLKSMPSFTYKLYVKFELLKACRKHNTTTCKSTYFGLTDLLTK